MLSDVEKGNPMLTKLSPVATSPLATVGLWWAYCICLLLTQSVPTIYPHSP